MKKKITPTTVAKTAPEATADVWVWDTELEGFGLRIKPTGRKIYVLRYRTQGGTQRKQNIGLASVLTPEKAREMARATLVQVAEGTDPMAERRAAAPAAATKTVGAMFEAYVASMRAKGRSSAAEVERVLLMCKNNAADALGRERHAGEVTPMEVVNYVSAIFKSGHRAAADKHRSYIASAYAWAMKSANDYTVAERQDWGIARNPAAEVPKDPAATQARDRNLTITELRALWQDTRPDSPGFSLETATCIRLLVACGQRVQETLRIEAKEIDLQTATWNMPAHKTKGRKAPHTIPLPTAIIPDLKLIMSINGDGPLFPIRAAGKTALMPHQSIMQAIERWCERSGVAHFQTRDLRRTWKSRAADAGIDRFTRDLIQQHAKGDTGSKHYDKADYLKPMRQAMDSWSNWIAENLEQKPALTLVA